VKTQPGISGLYALTHRVRWRIFGFLFAFGCIAYFQQKGITVAALPMMPALGISQVQIAWLEWAFVLGYALFQFPGGLIGQRIGARLMFTLIGAVAFAATALTPLVPQVLQGDALLAMLLALQLLMGLAQGAIFPVGSGVMEAWFRPEKWAFLQGFQSMGLQFAAAAATMLAAYLMNSVGWEKALLWPALPAVPVIVLWAWYGRNSPKEHPSVTAAELAELDVRPAEPPPTTLSAHRLRKVLSNRSVQLLTVSYVCLNYTFYLLSNWCFLYLVQERHFTVLEGGGLAMIPPLAAGVGAGVGGKLVALLCERFGSRWGFRLLPMISLPVSGLLLLVAVNLNNPYGAVIALALSYAALELNEGAYWGATMFVARSDTMSATGILNTGGNAGGLIGIPIVGYLSAGGNWTSAFAIGTAFAIVGALLWLGIDAGQVAAASEESSLDRPCDVSKK
jgi:ACS family glucarate transporter-like MFS transporter